MRIAYVVPSISRQGAGVSEVARLTALAMSEVPGVEVEVATLRDSYFDADIGSWNNVSVHAFPFYGPSNYGFAPELSAHLKKLQVDLVHVHGLWMFHCLSVFQWANATKGRYVITPHGMLDPWIMNRSPLKKRLVSTLYQKRFIENADAIHALTEVEASSVNDLYHDVSTTVIPNYVSSISDTVADELPAWYRPEFEGKNIYLFLSRIHEKKGCLELLEAWEQHCTNDRDFKQDSVLVYCGWLDGMDNFQQRVDSIAARHKNVIYAGPQYGIEKHRSYSVATFFILPSKSEGLPVAILEAWSYGKVVIMTSECNLKDGFDSGGAIKIAPNVSSISEGLDKSYKLTDIERKQMINAGRRLVEQKYSKSAVTSAFVNLYRSMISR